MTFLRMSEAEGSRASRASEQPPSASDPLHTIDLFGAPLEVCFDDSSLTLATYRNALLLVWHDRPQLPHVDAFARALDRLVPQHPKGVCVLVLIPAGVKPGEPEVEKAFTQALARHAHALQAEALVAVGGGFAAAVFRGILASVQRAIGGQRDVFGSVSEAASWIDERMRKAGAPSLEPRSMEKALDAIVEHHMREHG